MDLFHIDIILYFLYLVLVTPKILKDEINEFESKIIFVAISFFVFSVMIFLCQTFPLIMLVFLSLGFISEFNRRYSKF